MSARVVWLGRQPASPTPDEAEPGYSQLALSDPSADATSTQTWAAIEDAARTPGGRGPRAGALAAPTSPGSGPGVAVPTASAALRGAGLPPGEQRPAEDLALDAPARRGADRGRTGLDRPPGRSQRKRRRGKRWLLLAGLPMVVILVAVLYFALQGGKAPTLPGVAPTSSPQAAPNAPTTPPGQWKYIQSRADDPQPLTRGELFPPRFTLNGVSARLTVSKQSPHCSPALLGAPLQAAAKRAHCTQVLRASYLSTDGKLMATIGVLNLTDVTAANRVAKASGASAFIDPLPASHGPTRNIRKGTGIEEPVIKGHYLVLIWTEYTSLRRPATTAQRTRLERFASDVFAGTANVSLSSRMVTGKPSPAASPG